MNINGITAHQQQLHLIQKKYKIETTVLTETQQRNDIMRMNFNVNQNAYFGDRRIGRPISGL